MVRGKFFVSGWKPWANGSLEIAAENKTPPWTVEDVICATKHLNSGISKDPYGHPNELYKDGVAGQDLIKAVTTMMNKIKYN